jgi:hypothetical protein
MNNSYTPNDSSAPNGSDGPALTGLRKGVSGIALKPVPPLTQLQA